MPKSLKVVLVARGFILNDEKKILLIRRTSGERYKGLWEAPGGVLEEGESVAEGREREIQEETGLIVRLISVASYACDRIIRDGKHAGTYVVQIFGVTKKIGGTLVLNPDEHDTWVWVHRSEVSRFDLTPETRKAAVALRDYLK